MKKIDVLAAIEEAIASMEMFKLDTSKLAASREAIISLVDTAGILVENCRRGIRFDGMENGVSDALDRIEGAS